MRGEDSESEGVMCLEGGFRVPISGLFDYQITGVRWMWSLHADNKAGGILGDEMGLGKTVQVSVFLRGIFESGFASRALVVLPVAVVQSWKSELKRWAPGVPVGVFHGASVARRERAFRRVQASHRRRGGGILLTTYGMVRSNEDLFESLEWDYLVMDEAHRIRNAGRQISQVVRRLHVRHKLLLTGTPIQNNLQELWSIIDFVTDGTLLGDSAAFQANWASRIARASESDASVYERKVGFALAKSLKSMTDGYILRRLKSQVSQDMARGARTRVGGSADAEAGSSASGGFVMPEKRDYVLWVQLSEVQEGLYHQFLESEDVAKALNESGGVLAQINVLRKLSNHPTLLKVNMLGGIGMGVSEDDSDPPGWSPAELMAQSGKLTVLMPLLRDLQTNGHRVLVFSQSRKMLNIIQACIEAEEKPMRFGRIDGTISSTEERQRRIDNFNNKPKDKFCFLMTSQSCGVGVTLTGADRVVIFDPQWNPAMDAQAVDRAFRIGQKRDVIVYRFVAAGTVEEKIYRKQVFKSTITRRVTQNANQYCYFSSDELTQLFSLTSVSQSDTLERICQLHGHPQDDPRTAPEIPRVLDLPHVVGLSRHDRLHTQELDDPAFDEDEEAEIVQEAMTPCMSARKDSTVKSRFPPATPLFDHPSRGAPGSSDEGGVVEVHEVDEADGDDGVVVDGEGVERALMFHSDNEGEGEEDDDDDAGDVFFDAVQNLGGSHSVSDSEDDLFLDCLPPPSTPTTSGSPDPSELMLESLELHAADPTDEEREAYGVLVGKAKSHIEKEELSLALETLLLALSLFDGDPEGHVLAMEVGEMLGWLITSPRK